jgi:hypothetical protein
MNLLKIQDAILECYREMYLASEPSADFDYLMETAELDKEGRMIIKFLDYEIDNIDYDKIIENICTKYKIKGALKDRFKVHISLGVSPKIKQNK